MNLFRNRLCDKIAVKKTLGIIEIEPTVWKHLTDDEKAEILRICDEKLEKYFERISGEKN